MTEGRVTRRASFLKLAGAAVAGVAGWKTVDTADSSAGPQAVATGLVSCVLAPEQAEGPYYLPGDRVRRNVTEGKPGVPLTLKLAVVDVSSCRPIRGAAVDIWHCDALGAYAAESNETFLRGIQKTDARGVATFRTIYPGWYPGRTVHVHVKAMLGGNVVHTGQLYFPDATTDTVYRRSPYNTRPGRSTRNAGDAVYRNGGRRSTLKLRRDGSGYVGSIAMGVQR